FADWQELDEAGVAAWLAAQADGGAGRLGPLGPQLSAGGYARVFDAMVGAIHAGDIYQANLTFPLEGTWSGDPLAIYAALRRDGRAGHGGVVW
ncbi:hypothetical protein ABTC69_18250, partial [Acinetobacter baumannii]